MNFLSHYYFDKNSNPYSVLGCVLPDLLKHVVKKSNIHPERNRSLIQHDNEIDSILQGWDNHLIADKFFHNSDFFNFHTTEIKKLIIPVVEGSLVRPSFLAHISLELLLDYLLIKNHLIDPNHFYDALHKVEIAKLIYFLEKNEVQEIEIFINFYQQFLSSKYLLSYKKLENISYALNRICMRIWPKSLNETQINALHMELNTYQEILNNCFLPIFLETEKNIQSLDSIE